MVIFVIMAMAVGNFELRLGRTGPEQSSNLARVRASVLQRAGVRPDTKAKSAPTEIRAVATSSRQVVVKARLLVHGSTKGAPLRAHVKYLARERKEQDHAEPDLERAADNLQREETPGNERLSFYDRGAEDLDGKAITASWADDARHFRLIISAEDGEALGDLRPMIREVMTGLDQTLGTRLEWLAVDHWDTDNPHTHVLVRGRTGEKEDLFIPSKIIRHGLREHAQEIATRVLGPRLEADLIKEQLHEIGQMAITALDRDLAASQDGSGAIAVHRPDLIARLERLEAWDLASRGQRGWRIANELFGKLRSMERHREVEQAVANHLNQARRLPVLAADKDQTIQGQLVHFGPVDDFADGFLAVIETGRGELRYQRFERAADIARLIDVVPGATIAFEPNFPEIKTSDRDIAAVAERTGGLYSADHHLAEDPSVVRGLIEPNIRRLEAMRRMALVIRTEGGVFIVGEDHLKRAQLYEERIARSYPITPRVLSYWTLEEQIQAVGPTRLDRVLAGEAAPPTGEGGFARQHARALQQRRLFVIEQGWMRADEVHLSSATIKHLAAVEVRATADRLSKEIGKPVATVQRNSVRGFYAGRIDLAQGRAALIAGDRHASLVPWRPAMERFAGREFEGTMRGQGLSWRMVRAAGLGIGG